MSHHDDDCEVEHLQLEHHDSVPVTVIACDDEDTPVVTTTTTPATTSTPATTTTQPAASTSTAAPACQEDEPCWDCTTMGNQICGPTTTTIVSDIVDPVVVSTTVGVPANTTLPNTGTGTDLLAGGALAVLAAGVCMLSAARRRHA